MSTPFRTAALCATLLATALVGTSCVGERSAEHPDGMAATEEGEPMLAALHEEIADTVSWPAGLEITNLRAGDGWAWIEAAAQPLDGEPQGQTTAALLREDGDRWVVVERMPAGRVVGGGEGTAACHYFERLRSRHPTVPRHIFPPQGRAECPVAGRGAAPDSLAISLRAGEAGPLRRFAATAVRTHPDRLTLRLRSGRERSFLDEMSDGTTGHLFVYHGLIEPAGVHVVERVHLPEGRQYFLVDSYHGDATEVDAPPRASPDGNRLVTASLDLVAGHAPNRVRVYRMEPLGPVLEWELAPSDWGVRSPRWRGSTTIEAERVEVDWSVEPLGERVEPVRFEWRGRWVVIGGLETG